MRFCGGEASERERGCYDFGFATTTMRGRRRPSGMISVGVGRMKGMRVLKTMRLQGPNVSVAKPHCLRKGEVLSEQNILRAVRLRD